MEFGAKTQTRRPSTGRESFLPLHLTLLVVYLVVLGQEQFAGNSGGVSRCRRYLRQFLATKPSRNGLGVVTCRQEMLTPAAFATTLTIPPIISFLVAAR